MSKVHIALVGGQTIPVFNAIMATQPDKVVFIYSEQSTEEVRLIVNEIGDIPSEKRKIPPTDISIIREKFAECYERYKEDCIIVNISSGTKPWTFYAIAEAKANANIQFLYIDQNNRLFNLTTNQELNSNIAFDMDRQFRLQGTPIKRYRDFHSTFTKEREDFVLWQLRKLRAYKIQDFNALTAGFSERPNQKYIELPTGSFLQKTDEGYIMRLVKKNGDGAEAILSSPCMRQLLMNTGWFEYQVASLLSQWKYAKEIRMNCEFPSITNAPKNEIDIIVNTGDKLLFVECKTKIKDITAIDKFRNATRVYGGVSSKPIFITDEPFGPTEAEKCKDSRIPFFSLKNACQGFEIDFYKLLDDYVLGINTK